MRDSEASGTSPAGGVWPGWFTCVANLCVSLAAGWIATRVQAAGPVPIPAAESEYLLFFFGAMSAVFVFNVVLARPWNRWRALHFLLIAIVPLLLAVGFAWTELHSVPEALRAVPVIVASAWPHLAIGAACAILWLVLVRVAAVLKGAARRMSGDTSRGSGR